jgi:hypothetical protein
MKTNLIFKSSKALKRLASQTLKTSFFKIPYTNETTKEKGVWFVKDQGIYLMKAFIKPANSTRYLSVVYANGFDPNKDKNVWEKSRDAVGGDDFGEFLGVSPTQLLRLEKGHDLELKVSPKSIEVIV